MSKDQAIKFMLLKDEDEEIKRKYQSIAQLSLLVFISF